MIFKRRLNSRLFCFLTILFVRKFVKYSEFCRFFKAFFELFCYFKMWPIDICFHDM